MSLLSAGSFSRLQSELTHFQWLTEATAFRRWSIHSSDKLREPGYNIDFAAWLLARHIGEFAAGGPESPEAVALSAAAYNAGPSRVRAYVEGSEPLGEEAARYKDVVAGMWKERGAQGSPTYDAFRKEISGGSR